MNIETRQVGETVILQVIGRLDAENATVFEAQCESQISQGINQLVIDVGDLEYVSSMGLRSFMLIGKKLQEKGGKLRVCRQRGLVKQVFEITRLNSIFPTHDTVEAALADPLANQ